MPDKQDTQSLQLTDSQKEIIDQLDVNITDERIVQLIENPDLITECSLEDVVAFLQATNALYRSGEPVISDHDYDFIYLAELIKRQPDHEFLNAVEPEVVTGKTVKLPKRMLSTNKAYSLSAIEKWMQTIFKAAAQLSISQSDILFKILPKLDGYAAYDDATLLYTRGDGRSGTDITRAFERGMKVASGKRGCGAGEIVVEKDYFAKELAGEFENSRNFISSVIKEGVLDAKTQKAINDGAVCFQPFSELNHWIKTKEALLRDLESIWDENLNACPFDTDGLVIEITNDAIKEAMGSTNHHHRWQIAFKKNEEEHEIPVLSVKPQTSKNGRLTPVAMLVPTKVSGVIISRATAHHYGNVKEKGIGAGATVLVCRSGLVIPKILGVPVPAPTLDIPEFCPSCGAPAEFADDKYLHCTNTSTCPAQIERTIEFFFQTLGNCDGFGPKVIEKICKYGIEKIPDIYQCNAANFVRAGISPGVASNLVKALENSKKIQIEDWRFLAAFSIHGVGKGGCEKLLKHYRLADVFDLTVDDVIAIKGFAETSATSLVNTLRNIKYQFDLLMEMGFNLSETPLGEQAIESPIAGKTVVFTGTMLRGKRDDMKKHAKTLGAKVSDSVSKNTHFLVCGENVGAGKTNDAAKHNVTVISEDEYLALLGVA